MKNGKIQVGIAGFGMSGKIFQAPFLHADARFEIKKVFERSSERSKEEYPYVEIVRSFEELLTEEIDLVVISTPNSQHVSMAEQALKAGKNVIVEKPVAAVRTEAEMLCKLAEEKQVLFSVYQNRRLDGDFLTVKKLIEAGSLGEILDYECHFDRFVTGVSKKKWKAEGGRGVGIFYDLGVHIIDQAYSLFGMPSEVYADFRKLREETNGMDDFEVILYYPRLRVILSAGEQVAKMGPHFMIHGSRGSFIKYGMDVQENALLDGKRPVDGSWGMDAPEDYGILTTVEAGVTSSVRIPTEIGNYGAFYDNIYYALTEKAELTVNPKEAVEVLKIMELALQSQKEKGRVKNTAG